MINLFLDKHISWNGN